MVATFKGLVKRPSYQQKGNVLGCCSVQVYLPRRGHLIIYNDCIGCVYLGYGLLVLLRGPIFQDLPPPAISRRFPVTGDQKVESN